MSAASLGLQDSPARLQQLHLRGTGSNLIGIAPSKSKRSLSDVISLVTYPVAVNRAIATSAIRSATRGNELRNRPVRRGRLTIHRCPRLPFHEPPDPRLSA
jgi:hypothetical protein